MSALRLFGGRAGPPRRLTACCERQFSSTPACAINAIFHRTENPELNAVLKQIQDEIVFPSFLPPKQKSLVFNPKKRQFLAQNPIVIEVEGVEHKFSPIDRFKDLHNTTKLFNAALRQMQTPDEWDNLPTLLAGYRQAGLKLKPAQWGKIVRSANKTGNIYTAIECAKQADKTGFALKHLEAVVQIFAGVNQKITQSGWDKDETEQARRWVEAVLDMLYRPQHVTSTDRKHKGLQFSPLLRGMILFTRCSVVKVKQEAGEAIDRDLVALQDEVALCITLWKSLPDDLMQLQELATLKPQRSASIKRPEQLGGLPYVQMLAQIVKGIDMSREIVGEGAQELSRVRDVLGSHLAEFLETGLGKCQAWRDEYERIMSSAPSSKPAA
ncbi:hypothetical protein HIM_06501 [Hirsutella minnesotensis 3608]|uniref:Uncharacterized protein n=1 Tax=Hirsutella minnesotensis 3608 TaxID=1043627 RepID=A0A0F7ZZD9_9HYPO|nr:hypothetical protein HIM_06501 [Hirsutella minnesotensis 3608]